MLFNKKRSKTEQTSEDTFLSPKAEKGIHFEERTFRQTKHYGDIPSGSETELLLSLQREIKASQNHLNRLQQTLQSIRINLTPSVIQEKIVITPSLPTEPFEINIEEKGA